MLDLQPGRDALAPGMLEGPIAISTPKKPWAWPAMRAGLVAVAVLLVAHVKAVRSTVSADLVLVLALDVSASVDVWEYDLQRRGLADAIRHPTVLAAIASGPTRRIAVAVVQWSGPGERHVALPWTLIGGPGSAARLSAALNAMPRRFHGGRTDIAGMITATAEMALAAPVAAPRRVVDISGDGADNVAYSTHGERDRAVSAGVTLNALAIVNEMPTLDQYFRRYVIGGEGAFVMTAHDYEAFAEAIRRKLVREITWRLVG